MIGYRLEMSNSIISSLSAKNLLNKHLNETKQRFSDSIEIRNRIVWEKLGRTIDILESVLASHLQYDTFIRFNITSAVTSVTTGAYSAMEALDQMLMSDIKNDLFGDLDDIENAYEKIIAQSLKWEGIDKIYFIDSI